jgi:hypothetical protein
MELTEFPDFALISVSNFLKRGTLCLNRYLYDIVKDHGYTSLNLVHRSSYNEGKMVNLFLCKIDYMVYLYKKIDVMEIHDLTRNSRDKRPCLLPLNINVSKLILSNSRIDNLNTLRTLKHLELSKNNFLIHTIENLPNLESLTMDNGVTIPNIQNLQKLKTLKICLTCSFWNVSLIKNLPNLLCLKIVNTLGSMDPKNKVENKIIIKDINTGITHLNIGVDTRIKGQINLVNIENIFKSRPTNLKTFSITGNTSNSFLLEEFKSRSCRRKLYFNDIYQYSNI